MESSLGRVDSSGSRSADVDIVLWMGVGGGYVSWEERVPLSGAIAARRAGKTNQARSAECDARIQLSQRRLSSSCHPENPYLSQTALNPFSASLLPRFQVAIAITFTLRHWVHSGGNPRHFLRKDYPHSRRKTPGLIRKIQTKKASMTEQSVLRTFSLRVKPGQPRHRKSADGYQSGGDPKRFGRIQCIVESAVYGSFCLGSFWNLNRSKDERQW